MNKKIEHILDIWHKHFSDEENQYAEYEPSDIEYFVGCMLYNHFAFTKALDTLKTMDLSYDFLSSCKDEYDEIVSIINSINFEDEEDALKFLQEYIDESRKKYTPAELYLLNRLHRHVDDMAKRYNGKLEEKKVDFTTMSPHLSKPLYG
jgi:hypothetical protein